MPATRQPEAIPAFHEWGNAEFALSGEFQDALLGRELGRFVLGLPDGAMEGGWTSDIVTLPKPMNRLVPTWQANAPGDSAIEIYLQALHGKRWSRWFTIGRWTLASAVDSDGTFTSLRSSSVDQDEVAGQANDTLWAHDNWTAYRARVVMRRSDRGDHPIVRRVSVAAYDHREGVQASTSETTMAETINLPVPGLAQYAHNDEYAQLDGGGSAWCNPTSVSMILRYWGAGPNEQDIASLPADSVFDTRGREDGDVNYAAYHMFDSGDPDKGTGNWAFSTAYAASFGLDASVRQYNSLQELEGWIQRGVPLVVTINWDNTSADSTMHLQGTPIVATKGHLLVVRGFTAQGDVIVNDPAVASNAAVPHLYPRDQFERRWLAAKGGIAYVIKPYSIPG